MIDKKREVFERAVSILDSETIRIQKKKVKERLDVDILRCALSLESEELKTDEREVMKKAFQNKYFKKILNENKKSKKSKTRRNRGK